MAQFHCALRRERPRRARDARCVKGRGRSRLIRGSGRVCSDCRSLSHLFSFRGVAFTAEVKPNVKPAVKKRGEVPHPSPQKEFSCGSDSLSRDTSETSRFGVAAAVRTLCATLLPQGRPNSTRDTNHQSDSHGNGLLHPSATRYRWQRVIRISCSPTHSAAGSNAALRRKHRPTGKRQGVGRISFFDRNSGHTKKGSPARPDSL